MIFNHRVWLSWNQQASIHLLYITLEAAREDLPRYFGFSWPLTILMFEGDQVYWFNRWEELRTLGFKMLDCLMVPGYQRFFYDDEFPRKSLEVERAIGALRTSNLHEMTDAELIDAYSCFTKLYKGWYAIAWYAEPVQFCAEALMDEELRFLRDSGKVDARKIADAKLHLYSSGEATYSAAIEDSLLGCAADLVDRLEAAGIRVVQEQPIAKASSTVSVIAVGCSDGRDMTVTDLLETVLGKNPEFHAVLTSIGDHAQRYFWKHNNYHATANVTQGDVLAECLALAQKHSTSELRSRIGEGARRIQEAKPIRDAIYHDLRAYYRSVVDILARNSRMKDLRKRIVGLANHGIDLFLHEIAERSGHEIEEVRRLLPDELPECLSDPKGTIQEEIGRRAGATLIFWGEQDTAPSAFSGNPALRTAGGFTEHAQPSEWAMLHAVTASGETARKFLKALNEKFFFILDWGEGREIDSISGECAYARAGEEEIRGVVRVIRDPKMADDFRSGEILVAPSTTPDYVPLIRHASCLITDWGGWTSHAALCAREFNVPCIIGTYHASQVLSSGEAVTIRVREGLVLRDRRRQG